MVPEPEPEQEQLIPNFKRRRLSYDTISNKNTTSYYYLDDENYYCFHDDMFNSKNNVERENKRLERIKEAEEKIKREQLDIESKVKLAISSKRVIIELKCKKDEICALCIENLKDKKVQHTPCGHSFHMKCLEMQCSIYEDYNCSLCRCQIYS